MITYIVKTYYDIEPLLVCFMMIPANKKIYSKVTWVKTGWGGSGGGIGLGTLYFALSNNLMP